MTDLAARGGLDPREIQALWVGRKLTIGCAETMVDGVAFVQALAAGRAAPPAPWSDPPQKPVAAKVFALPGANRLVVLRLKGATPAGEPSADEIAAAFAPGDHLSTFGGNHRGHNRRAAAGLPHPRLKVP